jgi:hypothetical protein
VCGKCHYGENHCGENPRQTQGIELAACCISQQDNTYHSSTPAPEAVELYSTFIKKMKAENPQLNVSDVSFALGKAGKNSYGKRHSTGISNVSNAAVDDIFFEKHEYNDFTPDQNNTIRRKRLKLGHAGKSQTGAGNNNFKNNGKGATIKSLTRSIAALSTKIDKFSLPDDNEYEDESSDEEEVTSNHSNAALTRQSKKKKRGTN